MYDPGDSTVFVPVLNQTFALWVAKRQEIFPV